MSVFGKRSHVLRFVFEEENARVFFRGVFNGAGEGARPHEAGDAEVLSISGRRANDPTGVARVNESQGRNPLQLARGAQHGFCVFGGVSGRGHTEETHGLWPKHVQLALKRRCPKPRTGNDPSPTSPLSGEEGA